MKRLLAGVLFLLGACASGAQQEGKNAIMPAPNFDTSSHLFLEEVEGEAALTWVREQNARSLAVLEGDPRYAGYFATALKIATSKERIPSVSLRKGFAYNFWQDETHERGIWRRAPIATYSRAEPDWQVLLDVDALAKAEGRNWVYKGVSCAPPDYNRCLVSLSDGGKDAATLREFDLTSRTFPHGGFNIPEAKSNFEWADADTLLLATNWGPGSLTESGYPYIVKRLRRGQPLAAATEIFRGAETDVSADPFALEDPDGRRWLAIRRGETFFTSSYHVLRDGAAPLRVPVPAKSTLQGVFAGQLIVTLEEDWTPPGQPQFRAGDLVSFDFVSWLEKGALPAVEVVIRPNARQAIQGASVARGAILVALSDNVAQKVLRVTRSAGAWVPVEVPLPAKATADVNFASPEEGMATVGYAGFLDPNALYMLDTETGALAKAKTLPAWFDAAPYAVDQFEARSKDGANVPYFVVRRKDIALNGKNPTLLYGYGGFQISYTPAYSGTIGKLWLEQGGVYVLANIRGGGEFGPAWHQAGLKTKRQVIYDDFIAVAEDLIARGVTSKKHLGAMGGSNGGLLMGVMYTQRPDLFSAIVCEVPLLDMLRYHLLLAGASWMAEYGDPDVPEERAWLERLSPYHNVDPGTEYPEIYLGTSTKDDRVHPGHARKMAKRLQELGKPFLYYENIDGGHSAAANQREAARRAALEYTYLSRKLMEGK